MNQHMPFWKRKCFHNMFEIPADFKYAIYSWYFAGINGHSATEMLRIVIFSLSVLLFAFNGFASGKKTF